MFGSFLQFLSTDAAAWTCGVGGRRPEPDVKVVRAWPAKPQAFAAHERATTKPSPRTLRELRQKAKPKQPETMLEFEQRSSTEPKHRRLAGWRSQLTRSFKELPKSRESLVSENGELLEDCHKRLQEQLAGDTSTCSDVSGASPVDELDDVSSVDELDDFTLSRQLHNLKFEQGRDYGREGRSHQTLRKYGAATQPRPQEGEASDVVLAAVQRHHLRLAERNECLDLASQHRQTASVLKRNGTLSQDIARI